MGKIKYVGIIWLLVLLNVGTANAAVAWVANGTTVSDRVSNLGAVSSVLTVSGGTNNVLVAVVMVPLGITITSMVWDPAGANQGMTLVGTASTSGGATTSDLSMYTLVNPTAGASKNVTATFNTISSWCIISSAHFQGVDQTTPFRAGSYTTNTGTGTTLALAVTSVTDDMTVTALIGLGDTTPATDKTIIGAFGFSGFGPNMGFDRASGAATVTHTWSNFHFAGTDAVAGGSLAAASAAPPSSSGAVHRRIQ